MEGRMMNDEQKILPDRSVDLGDGAFWVMDRDKYELRAPTGRVYFCMSGDAVRRIQEQEKMVLPKPAFLYGLYQWACAFDYNMLTDEI